MLGIFLMLCMFFGFFSVAGVLLSLTGGLIKLFVSLLILPVILVIMLGIFLQLLFSVSLLGFLAMFL